MSSVYNYTKCKYTFRSGTLHSSIKVGGGFSLGRCQNKRFPGLVVCYEHATKDALALLARRARNEMKQLRATVAIRREIRK